MGVTLYGFEGTIKRLSKLRGVTPPIIEKATHLGMLVVEQQAKMNVAVAEGELKSKIKAETNLIGLGLESYVIVYAPHGVYVEFGTGPKGKNSPKDLPPNLRPKYKNTGWYIPVSKFPNYAKYGFVDRGGFIYTTGQPAQPYLYPAFKNNKELLKRIIINAVKEALTK